MHLFTDYIQPLTFWLYANPEWALIITFLMAFAESLAIVGSIIPGGVTMTAIGILAGSGVMDIGLTLIIAAAGAVAGDGASYALGYIFSDHLSDMWPFRRYPHWLKYGKEYFARHGGKSVIIGRFFGPLRSMIPLIAGILHMNPWHFLLANVISAIGWAILYVMPGVLIGAASTELSAESATRLFIFILIILVTTWLVSQGMKFLYTHANQFLHTQLRKIWSLSKHHPQFSYFLKTLTPKHEKNHFPTAGLILLLIICFCMSVLITVLVMQGTWITAINNPCQLFLQSVRTQSFDVFFIIISFIISPLSLFTFTLAITACAIYYRDWRMLRYWMSLTITCSSITWLLASFIDIPKPGGLLHYQLKPTYPAINLTLATALFGFLIGYANAYYRTITMLTVRIILASVLFLSGLALLYLGDNWASSVLAAYFIGLTISLAHWIYYRRHQGINRTSLLSPLPIALSCSLLLLTTCVSYPLYFKKQVREHSPYLQQFVLTHKAWWNQNLPLLPVYSTNRIGNRIGLFNIQYLGSLRKFEHALTSHGWKQQRGSLFYSLLMRASGQNSAKELPLMAQLYLNKKPTLIMTFSSSKGQILYVLRLWRSNYHLRNYRHPLWLGSIVSLQSPAQTDSITSQSMTSLFTNLLPALDGFNVTNITLLNEQIKSLSNTVQPKLLLIEEPALNN